MYSEWIDTQDWTDDEKADAYNICAHRTQANLNPLTASDMLRVVMARSSSRKLAMLQEEAGK